jgi:hypothetical protein
MILSQVMTSKCVDNWALNFHRFIHYGNLCGIIPPTTIRREDGYQSMTESGTV